MVVAEASHEFLLPCCVPIDPTVTAPVPDAASPITIPPQPAAIAARSLSETSSVPVVLPVGEPTRMGRLAVNGCTVSVLSAAPTTDATPPLKSTASLVNVTLSAAERPTASSMLVGLVTLTAPPTVVMPSNLTPPDDVTMVTVPVTFNRPAKVTPVPPVMVRLPTTVTSAENTTSPEASTTRFPPTSTTPPIVTAPPVTPRLPSTATD